MTQETHVEHELIITTWMIRQTIFFLIKFQSVVGKSLSVHSKTIMVMEITSKYHCDLNF